MDVKGFRVMIFPRIPPRCRRADARLWPHRMYCLLARAKQYKLPHRRGAQDACPAVSTLNAELVVVCSVRPRRGDPLGVQPKLLSGKVRFFLPATGQCRSSDRRQARQPPRVLSLASVQDHELARNRELALRLTPCGGPSTLLNTLVYLSGSEKRAHCLPPSKLPSGRRVPMNRQVDDARHHLPPDCETAVIMATIEQLFVNGVQQTRTLDAGHASWPDVASPRLSRLYGCADTTL